MRWVRYGQTDTGVGVVDSLSPEYMLSALRDKQRAGQAFRLVISGLAEVTRPGGEKVYYHYKPSTGQDGDKA